MGDPPSTVAHSIDGTAGANDDYTAFGGDGDDRADSISGGDVFVGAVVSQRGVFCLCSADVSNIPHNTLVQADQKRGVLEICPRVGTQQPGRCRVIWCPAVIGYLYLCSRRNGSFWWQVVVARRWQLRAHADTSSKLQ